jgi:histidinol-phosphate aminotransferase
MKLSIPDYILEIDPYVPGKPLEELERELGIRDSVKLASNENPLGSSPRALEAIQQTLGTLHRYPDGAAYALVQCIAAKLKVAPQAIVLGNGSDELIGMLARVLLRPGDAALVPEPGFRMYEIMIRSCGATTCGVPLTAMTTDLTAVQDHITPSTRLIFLNNPHNPTGTIFLRDDFERFLEALPPGIVLVLDEAYIEFVRDPACPHALEYLQCGKPVVGLRTFSKAYGLAGLRIGYGIMPSKLAELLHRIRQPFNINSLAQAAAMAALDDDVFVAKTVEHVHAELDFMYAALNALGIGYFKSQANFFLIDVGEDAKEVFEALLREGVIVRAMTSYGLTNYIRINVGLHHENIRFLEALTRVLGRTPKLECGRPMELKIEN